MPEPFGSKARQSPKGTAFIGTSGFNYSSWRGVFYPEGLPSREWLSFYSSRFRTVELNVTFYRLPRPSTIERWAAITPRDFRFVLKGSRYITHLQRLKDCREPLEVFLKRIALLGEKLSVVLWQLPPSFAADMEGLDRFKAFLELLSGFDTKGSDAQANGAGVALRHAFEFRHRSWFELGTAAEVYEKLRCYNGAIVMSDWPFQVLENEMPEQAIQRPAIRAPATSDWLYVRRHGPGDLYRSEYTEEMLSRDAGFLAAQLARGRDVYCFFNNDIGGAAVRNALRLKELVEQAER